MHPGEHVHETKTKVLIDVGIPINEFPRYGQETFDSHTRNTGRCDLGDCLQPLRILSSPTMNIAWHNNTYALMQHTQNKGEAH